MADWIKAEEEIDRKAQSTAPWKKETHDGDEERPSASAKRAARATAAAAKKAGTGASSKTGDGQ